MAYSESTSVADRDAFIQALVNFAVANAGFTDQGSTFDDPYTIYHISKGSIYWNFVADLYISTWDDIPAVSCRMTFAKILTRSAFTSTGTAGQVYATLMCVYHTGPFEKYYLYTDGVAVHCALQIYNGVFSHISFGNVTKFGTWTGGEFLTANGCHLTYSGHTFQPWDASSNGIQFDGGNCTLQNKRVTGYVRHLIAAPTSDRYEFARLGAVTEYDQKCIMTAQEGMMKEFMDTCGSIGFNLRAPLLPVYVRTYDTVTARWWLIGYVSGARLVSIEYISPEAIMENEWIAFPMIQLIVGGDTALAPRSGYWGVAYKRVA